MPASRRSTAPALAVIGSAATFGAATVANKALLGDISPLTLAGWLYAFSGVGLLLYTFLLGRLRPPGKGWLFALSTVTGIVGAPLLYYSGLRLTSASEASLLANLEIAMTVILAFVLGERGGRRHYIALLLLALGLVAVTTGLRPDAMPMRAENLAGNLLVLAGSALWGIDANLSRRLVMRGDYLGTVAAKSALGGAMLLLVSTLILPEGLTLSAAGTISAVALVSFGLGYLLYYAGLRALGAMWTGALYSTQALFGALLGALLLGERLEGAQYAGGVLMAVAVAVLPRTGPSAAAGR